MYLAGNIWYCSSTWVAQLIRGIFYLDISFSCISPSPVVSGALLSLSLSSGVWSQFL